MYYFALFIGDRYWTGSWSGYTTEIPQGYW